MGKPSNRISGYVDSWPREVGVLAPKEPTDEQVQQAWKVINEFEDTYMIVEDLYESMQILRRSSKVKTVDKEWLNRYNHLVVKMFEAAQLMSRQIGEDFEKSKLPDTSNNQEKSDGAN